jgi:rhamnose transport system substrate-binding protein
MIRKTAVASAIAVSLSALAATLLARPSVAAHRRYTIASVEYGRTTAPGGRAAAKRLGMRYIVDPDNLGSEQGVIRYYKKLIARHVDAIVSAGYDPALKPVFRKVRKAGILLVSAGDDIAGRRDLWVNYSALPAFGRALADALASQINKRGEYAILEEQHQFPVADTWEKIVATYIPKAYPNMKLDGMLDLTGAGDQTEVDTVKSFMAAHPNLKGLIGIAPTEAYMAAAAITQAGRIGQVFSAGNGGSDFKGTPLVEWVRSGAMEDVVVGDPIKLGYLTVWAAHYLLTGHHFRPGAYRVGGPIDLVWYYAKHRELRLGQPITITKKNVDRYANRF